MRSDPHPIGTAVRSVTGALGRVAGLLDTAAAESGADSCVVDVGRVGLVLGTLFLVVAGLGCGAGAVQDTSVIASSPSCLLDEGGDCTSAVTVAASEADVERALLDWGYALDDVRFAGRPLIFVAFGETSDCHAVVERASAAEGAVVIEIGLEDNDSCNTDSRPRSFVLDVRTTAVDSVEVNGRPVHVADA